MKVLVLNGSPKGNNSVTLQISNYLAKRYNQCQYTVLHVGQKLNYYANNMESIKTAIDDADMVVFSYPVYTFLTPYQLAYFVQLLHEHNISLQGKAVTQILTSKHFYDVTAIGYIEANIADLGGKYLPPLSLDPDDLLSDKGRRIVRDYWDNTLFLVENNYYTQLIPIPTTISPQYTSNAQPHIKQDTYNAVIVTNCTQQDTHLANIIADFVAIFPYNIKVVNILDFPFSGGCLGCMNCVINGKCIYKDDYATFLQDNINNADAIIYAFTITCHSMGASMKIFDDRQFCNGHRMLNIGTPVGYIVCGNYSQEANLQLLINGRVQVGHNNLMSIVTDQTDILPQLQQLSGKLTKALQQPQSIKQNFLGIGGTKIFRDLIFEMRGFMREDHRFYKKHGIYDFPHKKRGTIMKMKLVGAMLRVPAIKKKISPNMTKMMLAPYAKIVDDITK